MNRRDFLAGVSLAGLTGCAARTKTSVASPPALPTSANLALPPVQAKADRIFRTTVCLRPFRAAGPRLDVERVGEKTVVHNYGHGGSGWSLSWGSSAIATEKAMTAGARDVAVIGCGALGLTSAILLQRAGATVTIYAKERPPDVRSARATGTWTPDSRVALRDSVSPDFPALWEQMCRTSFRTYASYLGMAGNPVEWSSLYFLSDGQTGAAAEPRTPPLEFAHYGDRVRDLTPRSEELAPGTHPFPTQLARRTTHLMFNIAGYSRQLVNDFLVEGGRIERREFHDPRELNALPQTVIVNCTGYGARALWKDESIVPVRGQIAWLIPQPELDYGIIYKGVLCRPRRDGIVVQAMGTDESYGYGDANEEPNRQEADAAVETIADLYRRMAS